MSDDRNNIFNARGLLAGSVICSAADVDISEEFVVSVVSIRLVVGLRFSSELSCWVLDDIEPQSTGESVSLDSLSIILIIICGPLDLFLLKLID